MQGEQNRDPAREMGAYQIPSFTLTELAHYLCEESDVAAHDTTHILAGFPELLVRKICINDMCPRRVHDINGNLVIFSHIQHPGIVRYHQILSDSNSIYVIADHHPTTLRDVLVAHVHRKEPVPERLLLLIAAQVASAMASLDDFYKDNAILPPVPRHSISLDTILANDSATCFVVADPGFCRDSANDEPPERDSPMSSAAYDTWRFGIVLYQLATLQPSPVSDNPEWMPDLSVLESDVLKDILEQIFVENPEDRPSPHELAAMLVQKAAQRDVISSSELDASVAALESAYAAFESAFDDFKETHSDRVVVLSRRLHALRDDMDAKLAELERFKQIPDNLASLDTAYASYHLQILSFTEAIKALGEQLREPGVPERPPVASNSWTQLMRAAVSGDIEAAKRHLDERDERNSDGDTALVLAARAGQAGIVELLDPTDENGVTALMRAADRGDMEAVQLLLPLQKRRQAAGYVAVDGWGVRGRTALIGAALYGHSAVAQLLAEYEGRMTDRWGWTALMMAACRGHHSVAQLLAGVEAGMQNADGCTALMYAAANNHLKCIVPLLRKEACKQDANGATALMRAAYRENPDCVKMLAKREKGMVTTCELHFTFDSFPCGSKAFDMIPVGSKTGISTILSQYPEERPPSSW